MDFQGKVIQFLGEVTGVSKAGNPWKKKEWVVETFGQYPKKVKLQCFGDRADNMNLELGQDYNLFVDLESREFNGRWYTDVSVFRAEVINVPQPTSQPGVYTPPQQGYGNGPYGNSDSQSFSQQSFTSVEESDEDLPF